MAGGNIFSYEHTDDLPAYLNIAPDHEDIDVVVILLTNTSAGNSAAPS